MLNNFRSLAWCATLCLSLWLPQRSSADAGSERQYKQLISEGVKEYKRGHYVEARAIFERAHEASPNARTLRGIGLAAFHQKDYVRALTALSAAMDDQRKPLNKKQRKHARGLIGKAADFVGRYTLEVTPSDASVSIDSREPVVFEGKVVLNPGQHELVVRAAQHVTATRRLDVEPRDDETIRITLEPVVVAAVEAPTPAEAAEQAPPAEAPNAAEPGDTKGWSRLKRTGVGLAGAGVLSLGASLYFGLTAKSKRDDARAANCTQTGCPTDTANDLNNDALTFSHISTATSVAGGLLVAGGAVLFFVPFEEDRQNGATMQASPAWSPGYAGLVLRGNL